MIIQRGEEKEEDEEEEDEDEELEEKDEDEEEAYCKWLKTSHHRQKSSSSRGPQWGTKTKFQAAQPRLKGLIRPVCLNGQNNNNNNKVKKQL